MVELVAHTPAEGLCPIEHGNCVLSEVHPGAITWAASRVAAAGLPQPGQTLSQGGRDWIWFGPGQALVLGAPLEAGDGLVVSDQSDAWAVLRLAGESAADVLARLTPLDLRPQVFEAGQTARTLLGHMAISLTCRDTDVYDIMVFRSMTSTAVHEIGRAMKGVAARG